MTFLFTWLDKHKLLHTRFLHTVSVWLFNNDIFLLKHFKVDSFSYWNVENAFQCSNIVGSNLCVKKFASGADFYKCYMQMFVYHKWKCNIIGGEYVGKIVLCSWEHD